MTLPVARALQSPSGSNGGTTHMLNKDTLAGSWKQLKGKAKEQWGKLTDDDLDETEGREERLLGIIQKRYGLKKDEAKAQFDRWLKKLDELH